LGSRPAQALRLDKLHSGDANLAGHGDAIELAMFNSIMRNHRTLPLLFPLIAVLTVASLESQASALVTGIWLAAVFAIWIEIGSFSARYFQGRLSSEPSRLVTSLTLRYVNANIVWSTMLVLFWSPSLNTQDFFLLLLFVAHLAIATATTAYEWRIYLACTLPIATSIVVACLQAHDPIYIAVGALVTMVYAFMLTVTRQVVAKAKSAIALRLEHDDLIRDLASAKASSDTALRDTEAANERLRLSERRFRALVDNAFDGVGIVGADGSIRFCTETVARMFDAAPEQLIGLRVHSLAVPECQQKIDDLVEQLFPKPGASSNIAVWAESFSGRKIWIEATARNMLHDDAINGIVLNIRDSTERLGADSELKMHLRVLEKLATGSSMAQVLTELTEAIEEQKTGVRASILLLDEENKLRMGAAPSLPPLYEEVFDGMMADNEAGPCGIAACTGKRVIVSDASTDPIFEGRRELAAELEVGAAWSSPIMARDGRVLGSVAMIYQTANVPSESDLKFLSGAARLAAIAIERRRAEQRLAEALRTAEIANHSKSQFLANMSHELRTPLNAIIGFSEMIREEMFGPVGAPEYVDYIKDIHSSGRHLLELINDILDISKIEAGQFELDEVWADLKILATWSADLVRPRAQENNVAIVIDIADNVPQAYVDERAVKQIMLNLLSNATKFTPDGGEVALSASLAENGDLLLNVSDTGIGIERHMIDKVMEPFGQAEGPMARSYGGTGLGLPITKSLTELHGGRIHLESELGVGTTVTVRMPAWRTTQDGPGLHSEDQARAVSH